jgi:hypothetical protein
MLWVTDTPSIKDTGSWARDQNDPMTSVARPSASATQTSNGCKGSKEEAPFFIDYVAPGLKD